jgi:hypothetical protein
MTKQHFPHYPVPDFAVWKPGTELPADNREVLVMVSGPDGMQAEVWSTDKLRGIIQGHPNPERFYFVEMRSLIPYQLKYKAK